jgi:riboflavin biosynthesis pyrimidine reductase
VRQLLPHPADDVDPAVVYGNAERVPPAGRPWVLSDFVASADGSATAEGRSRGLSGPGDRKVFHALRALADLVLVGASTVRVEGYRPARPDADVQEARRSRGQAPVPPIAVVSQTLQFDWSSTFFTDAVARPLIVTSSATDEDARTRAAEVADVIVAGEERVDLRVAFGLIADHGHRIVLTEGGPMLHGEIVLCGLLDELCLTISPLLACGMGPRITNGPPCEPAVEMDLAHLLEEDGFLFLRYVRAAYRGRV